MKRKRIGIGVSDFRELREAGFLFVDKSLLIEEVAQAGAKVILLPRPRRFGKTLNLSMRRCFFERCEDEAGRRSREALFRGLAIHATETFRAHFARYPVIFLTFKDVKERDYSAALFKLKRLLRDEVERHLQGKTGPVSSWSEPLVRLMEGTEEPGYYQESLKALSRWLHERYGVPPVILIDEYDTPIHAAWQHGYYDELIGFMRGLLSAVLKDNPHIAKGVISGILRVAWESIFSDLNNLDVYTILERPFADKFGLTRQEVVALLEEYGLGHRLDEVDAWYNGYDFGGHVMFNPWSILNFVNQNPPTPQPYWANTSSNALIRELIVGGGLEVREQIERLMAGGAIESVIERNMVFPDLRKKPHYIYSLFFFSGYLKCAEQRLEGENLVCRLRTPNREVRYIFHNIIAGWLEESFENAKLTTMLRSLVAGDLERFSRLLNEFVITTLSFFDTKGKNPEAVYQAFVLGLLLHLGRDYEISSNRELGYGRYDILIAPKRDRSRPAVLMEMKSITGFYEEEPEKAIREAVEQIGRRVYAKELETRGFENVLKIVVVSDGKKVWVRKVEG